MKFVKDYNPDQPRDEGGEGGGQWVAAGGGGASKSSKGGKSKTSMSPEVEKAARERAAKIGIKDPTPKELAHFAKKVAAESGPPKSETKTPVKEGPKVEAQGPLDVSVKTGKAQAFTKVSDPEYPDRKLDQKAFQKIAKYGGDEHLAAKLMAEWRHTSDSKEGAQLRAAFAVAAGGKIEDGIGRLLKQYPDQAEQWKTAAESFVKDKTAMATVKAIIRASQESHSEDTVTLWRGVEGKQAEQLLSASKEGKAATFATDIVASFSDDIETARNFAGQNGVVVEMKVPRSAIVMSHKASGGMLAGENEILVATKGGYTVKSEQVKHVGDVRVDETVAELEDRQDWDESKVERDERGQFSGSGGKGLSGGDYKKRVAKAEADYNKASDTLTRAIRKGLKGNDIKPYVEAMEILRAIKEAVREGKTPEEGEKEYHRRKNRTMTSQQVAKALGVIDLPRSDDDERSDEFDESKIERDERGRFSSTGGGEGAGDGGVRAKALNALFGNNSDRKPMGTDAPGYWKGEYTKPAQMSRAEAKAKVEELRKQVTTLQDEGRWNDATEIEQTVIPATFRAGYQPTEEVVNPSWDEHDEISQPGHLYRGMEQAEFEATVGAGKGVQSKNLYSAESEGTSFGYEAHTAHDYVNTGRSNPLRTGKPNYIVEVKPDETMSFNRTAGYPQTATGQGLAHQQITRVWKYEARDGKIYRTEIEVPKAASVKDHEPDITKDIMKGNFGIERKNMPQFERDKVLQFLDRLDGRGVGIHYNEPRRAADLKATQSTLRMDVVRRMSSENRHSPIVVSSDGFILDGHHRWAAARLNNPDAEIRAHRVNLPIKDLLREALSDPASTRTDTVDLEDVMLRVRLDAAIAELLAEKAELERRIDALYVTRDTVERLDFDDDQPRDEGGRWTSGGGGGGGKKGSDTLRAGGAVPAPKNTPSKGLKEIGERLSRSYREVGTKGPAAAESKRISDAERKLAGLPPKTPKEVPEKPRKGLEETAARASDKLPEAHDKYFNTDKPGTKVVPVDKLLTIRARPTGIENAEKHMAKAFQGEGKKRDPISVSENEDGTYSVEDGNSTTAIARKHGWETLPVQVVERTDQGKAAHFEHKVKSALDDIKDVQENGKDVKGKMVFLSKDVSLEQHREIAETEIAKHTEGLSNFKETLGKTTGVHFEGRVKKLDSALGKVARKPHNYKTAGDLQDLTGVRAVTQTVQQSREIAQKIAAEYKESYTEEKLEPHQVENGGYRAIHMIVKDHDGLYKEIQIQTARQRAFQEWSHDVYKPQTEAQSKAVGTDKNPGPHRAEALAYGNAMSLYFFNKDQGKDASKPGKPHPEIVKAFGLPKDV